MSTPPIDERMPLPRTIEASRAACQAGPGRDSDKERLSGDLRLNAIVFPAMISALVNAVRHHAFRPTP